MVGGPGIPRPGVSYWFSTEKEVVCFIENLNLSYSEGKRLSSWRKHLLCRRTRPAVQQFFVPSSAATRTA